MPPSSLSGRATASPTPSDDFPPSGEPGDTPEGRAEGREDVQEGADDLKKAGTNIILMAGTSFHKTVVVSRSELYAYYKGIL